MEIEIEKYTLTIVRHMYWGGIRGFEIDGDRFILTCIVCSGQVYCT